MTAVLRVERFGLRRGAVQIALPELVLARGGAAVVYGPSGCGKTTLLRALFALGKKPGDEQEGRVVAFGRDLAALSATERRGLLRTNIAWILQDAQGALDPFQPIGEQIRQATYRSFRDGEAALAALGIDDAPALARRLPHAISGGQAQRVLFAVASLRQPELVVADEPTASLDDRSCAAVAERLQQLREQGAALLVASHDHRLIGALGAEVFVVRDGAFLRGAVPARAWPASPATAVGETPVLRARDVRVRLGDRQVLDSVDLDLHRGESVALLGDSGAGKTTLARVLAGHREPDQGSVERPMRRFAVQMLPQDAAAALTPGRTLRALVEEAHAPFFDLVGTAASLSLPVAVLDRTVAEMSGGERRRAALLRALAVHPDVLVLDEPTASLDHETAVAVIATLMTLREQRGVALLLVTHDAELARAVSTRVLTLSGGRM